MRNILKFELEYRLKPHQPSIQQIDFDELEDLLNLTIEGYLAELSESLEDEDDDHEEDSE